MYVIAFNLLTYSLKYISKWAVITMISLIIIIPVVLIPSIIYFEMPNTKNSTVNFNPKDFYLFEGYEIPEQFATNVIHVDMSKDVMSWLPPQVYITYVIHKSNNLINLHPSTYYTIVLYFDCSLLPGAMLHDQKLFDCANCTET